MMLISELVSIFSRAASRYSPPYEAHQTMARPCVRLRSEPSRNVSSGGNSKDANRRQYYYLACLGRSRKRFSTHRVPPACLLRKFAELSFYVAKLEKVRA